MPRAKKTQTTKKKEPTLKQLVKQEVQKQLEEALLNIEFDNPESDVDISSIEKNTTPNHSGIVSFLSLVVIIRVGLAQCFLYVVFIIVYPVNVSVHSFECNVV